jgi:transposase
MKPLYAHDLTEDERAALQTGLKSRAGLTVRRSQMLLLSADERLKPQQIARRLGCSDQAVREAIHAFEREGLTCLKEKPRGRPEPERAFTAEGEQGLLEALVQSPRRYGYDTSLWTLALLADLSARQGWTAHRVHIDTVSATLHRLGIRWKRAKARITSPDAHYTVKKSAATG